MQPMHVPAGATTFRAGDPSIAVYVIEDGEVAITVDGGADRLEAERFEVVRLHAGELFGESGVLEERVRAATATAVAAITLLVTDAETFVRAFGMGSDRTLALVKLLCRRLRDMTRRAAQPDQPLRPASADGAANDVPKGDARGNAMEMPGQPRPSILRKARRILSYPVSEPWPVGQRIPHGTG